MYENNAPAWVTYDEGRVVLNSNGTWNINEAYLKDHLGNVRVAFYYQYGTLKTQQVNSYYPFGMNIKGLSANGSATYKPNEYLYNGKMMQDEMGLGWLDYGARFYDAVLGRWHSKEHYAELVPGISPYAYCYDDPVNFNEPDGKWPPWIHRRIIRKALNPYIGHGLTKDQIDLIISGGEYIDINFQAAQYSYRHSMRNGLTNQSILSAIAARDEWVSNNIAVNDEGDYEHYFRLGYAIHAMSDQYSPTHSWKPWKGQPVSSPSSWIHFFGELNPLGSRSNAFKLSVELVKETYLRSDPPEGTSKPNPEPRPKSEPIAPIDPRPMPPTPTPQPPNPQPTPPSPVPSLTPLPIPIKPIYPG